MSESYQAPMAAGPPDERKPLWDWLVQQLRAEAPHGIRDAGACWHPTPKQLATMLECIASEVERRGDIDHDRDPWETADWLRAEAKTARDAAVNPSENVQ